MPCAPRLPLRQRPLRDEAGSALAEVAILLPVLLLPIFYGLVFTDLSLLRLKTLEAARLLAWEKTVHRPADAVREEVRARFADLDGTGTGTGKPALTATALLPFDEGSFRLDDRGVVPLAGTLPAAPSEPGFEPPRIHTLDEVLKLVGLNPVGLARAEVTLAARNVLVPTSGAWGQWLAVEPLTRPLVFQARHVLIYDTWRAWPSPLNLVGETDLATDPATTYETAERLVAAQVARVAFLGLGGNEPLQKVMRGASSLGLPLPLATHGASEHGPTTLRPADPRQVAPFSPAAGRRDATRLGSRFALDPEPATSPEPGVDRGRYTLPFRVGTEQWYRLSGGGDHRPLRPTQRRNDYARTWDCRGPYFLGHREADLPPRDPEAWSGCVPGPAAPPGGWDRDGDLLDHLKQWARRWGASRLRPPRLPTR